VYVFHVQAKNGYRSLTGIDYCNYAIELAKSVACDEQLDIELKVRWSVSRQEWSTRSSCILLHAVVLSNMPLNKLQQVFVLVNCYYTVFFLFFK